MAQLIGGYQISASIGALARLGVADALLDTPLHPHELAERVGADTLALSRVLRALDATGLLATLGDGKIALTGLGELLCSDVPGSARRAAIASTEEWRWRAYGHLTHSVRTGEPGFRRAHGCELWEYLAQNTEAAALFDESMARVAAAIATVLVDAYDFGAVERLVDVGGGHGILTSAILEANPHLRAVILDLPGVIEGARAHLAAAGLAGRCDAVAGDFLDAVPAGGDLYLLSWILHDWDDSAATRILENCRAVMREGGRLLAIEMVVTPGNDRLVRTTDLEMLVVAGGRERTADEYAGLYRAGGFELNRIVPLDGLPWSVLEGA
jgi:hypothetical protein